MIIDDFNVRTAGRTARPSEADSLLRVDPYAELTAAIAFQGLQMINSQRTKLVQTCGRIEDFETAIGLSGKTLEFANEVSFCERRVRASL
jgi:hypothetical protein